MSGSNIGRLNHVGVAVPSIEAAKETYRTLYGATDITDTITLQTAVGSAPPGPAFSSITPATGSIDVPVAQTFTLTANMNMQPGTGSLEIRDKVAGTVIETLTLPAALGTGSTPAPGKVIIQGNQAIFRPSADLPASKQVSFRPGAGFTKDLAGNASVAVTDDSFAVTTLTPPVVGGLKFGRLTPAGQAGVPATTFADASGHFQLVGGKIVVSAAGAAAGLPNSTYPVTVDGQATTISVVANARSVEDWTQVQAALAIFDLSPSVDSIVMVRDGSEISGNTARTTIGGVVHNGVMYDPNAAGFVTITTKKTYNRAAVAAIAGGSITIKADTKGGAAWTKICQTGSNANIIFDGLIMESLATKDGRQMWENANVATPPGSNAMDQSSATAMIQAGLDLSPIITHRLPYQEFEKGFETMISGEGIKVVLSVS